MNVSSARAHAPALCLLASLALSPFAFAGDGPGCKNRSAHLDVEGSAFGQLSASDHAAGSQKRFEAMDANHDGKLTAAEIGATQGAERIAWARNPMTADGKIKAFDRNRDGTLSAQEYADGSQALFNELDTNGDGYLKADEMAIDTGKVSARN